MRLRHPPLTTLALGLVLLATPTTAQAQSLISAAVAGRVTSPAGDPIAGVIVTLTSGGERDSERVTTSAAGAFDFAVVAPGSYEVRAEAVGYRPLVARTLTITGGERASLGLTLTPAEARAITIDTLTLGGGSTARHRAGEVRLGSDDINELPVRTGNLAEFLALSSHFDDAMGAEGLPGDLTLAIADGLPFRRAGHPALRSEAMPHPLFNRSSLASAVAMHAPADIEWAGSTGAYAALTTGSAGSSAGLSLDGAFTGGPLWWSNELDADVPSSFEGSLGGAWGIGSTGSRAEVSGSVLSHRTPTPPRAPVMLSIALTGVDPDVLMSLSEAGMERYDRYSGLARVDIRRSTTTRIYLRALGSFARRDFDGWGPAGYTAAAAPQDESVDVAIGGGVLSAYSRTVSLELRGGFTNSSRDFGGPDVPAVHVTAEGASLGTLPAVPGSSSRTDAFLSPLIHYTSSVGRLKAGASFRTSNHTFAHSSAALGDLAFSDAAALLAGRGWGRFTSTPGESFGTREVGVFAQYTADPAPGLRITLGGRFDHERLPIADVSANADWRAVSGLDNSAAPEAFEQLGARGVLTWEPSATAGTVLSLVGSLDEGEVDPRAVYELLGNGTNGSSTVHMGTGLDWQSPDAPTAAAPLPTLALLGPDARPPRSVGASVGLAQRLGDAVTLRVSGTSRRTDFLLRRRNFNLPVVASAQDPNGRDVFGTLQKDGALVAAPGDDARRFAGFAEVWALDPDGWSERRAFTASIEHGRGAIDFFGAYTRSQTTDNWVGAASGSIDAGLSPNVPTDPDDPDWSEGPSDFDVTHSVAAATTVDIGAASLSARYTFRSGLPFTPRYRYGVDANGDGSLRNDVAFVPSEAELGAVLEAWPCLRDQALTFAARNSCRGPGHHNLNIGLRVTFAQAAGKSVSLVVDALNLLETSAGLLDDALLLVDPNAPLTTSADGSTVTIPFMVNQDFGQTLYPNTRGRMLRIGMRIGG